MEENKGYDPNKLGFIDEQEPTDYVKELNFNKEPIKAPIRTKPINPMTQEYVKRMRELAFKKSHEEFEKLIGLNNLNIASGVYFETKPVNFGAIFIRFIKFIWGIFVSIYRFFKNEVDNIKHKRNQKRIEEAAMDLFSGKYDDIAAIERIDPETGKRTYEYKYVDELTDEEREAGLKVIREKRQAMLNKRNIITNNLKQSKINACRDFNNKFSKEENINTIKTWINNGMKVEAIEGLLYDTYYDRVMNEYSNIRLGDNKEAMDGESEETKTPVREKSKGRKKGSSSRKKGTGKKKK